MVVLISHRGNLNGPNKDKENHPIYIVNALRAGYDVEVDLWYKNNQLYLGHDDSQYKIDYNFLYEGNFWIHAKNIDAAYYLTHHKMLNWFFHNQDDCVLTSKGYLWTYIGKQLTPNSIAVMPEKVARPYDLSFCYGICTDYPDRYKSL